MAKEKTVYDWGETRVGFYWSRVDPQLVGEELQRIAAAGKLTPEAVIDEAKNKKSPLHKAFEWDVGKAAHAHLKTQARHLIGSLRIVKVDEAKSITRHRAFFNIINPDGHEYVTRTEVAKTEDYRVQVYNDTIRWLRRAQERLADIEGLEKEAVTVGRVIRKIERQRKVVASESESVPIERAI